MNNCSKKFIVGIDASNLRLGGGVTHIIELLRALNPVDHDITHVVVWGGKGTLSLIEDRSWLIKRNPDEMDKSLFYRIYWQKFQLSSCARSEGCHVLLVPGGSYSGNFHPVLVISQNLLPFEFKELRRYGFTWMALKMLILRLVQKNTFRRADGVIFLTKYAKHVVIRVTGKLQGVTKVIPHGLTARFMREPREQKSIDCYSDSNPFRILYISTVDVHKHQWHVVEAVEGLRRRGISCTLQLIGPGYPCSLDRLRKISSKCDPNNEFITYEGAIPNSQLHEYYAGADLFLFASSCENMPIILMEAMASGLPIACSRLGPMPEILGDAGVYFDPTLPSEIAESIMLLIERPKLRSDIAKKSFALAQQYSWQRCSRETFEFLANSGR